MFGAYVCGHLSFKIERKGLKVNAMIPNRTREIRLSGMKAGASGTVTESLVGKPPALQELGTEAKPEVSAPEFYPNNPR